MLRTTALALVAVSALALPVAAQEFSADLVRTGGDAGAAQAQEKIYVQGSKARIERGSGRGGAILADGAAKTAYMLLPQQKAYVDMSKMGGRMVQIFTPVNPDDPCPQWQAMMQSAPRPQQGGGDAPGSWSCRRIGNDVLNGRQTVKYAATSPKGEENLGWIDPRLRFLVKVQNAKGGGIELQNIKEGPQQAALFAVPADWQKIDMAGMMKKMAPQGGKAPE